MSIRKLKDIRSLARTHTATAINTLAGIMRSEDIAPAARVAACKELLDRGHGKSIAAVELSGEVTLLDCFNALAEREAASSNSRRVCRCPAISMRWRFRPPTSTTGVTSGVSMTPGPR